MEISYWLSRWNKNKIGFHSPNVNPYLIKFENEIQQFAGKHVLVPFCGKTLDLIWLAEKGFQVVGVEVARIACIAFFEENKLEFNIKKRGKFEIFQSEFIEIWCGSLFDLPSSVWTKIDWIYDRASVGALPPEMRKTYFNVFNRQTKPETNLMMHAFEYDNSISNGPPFSVLKKEIIDNMSANWDIYYWFDEEVLQKYQGFKARGLSSLREQVYWMKKKGE